MAKIKCNLEGIDEAALLQSIYEQDNPPPQAIIQPKEPVISQPKEPEAEASPVSETTTETPKDEGKRKRSKQDYETMFIRESNITARLGKTVYIRKEFHDRILKIVQVIGDNEVSLFSYIDNIIAHHFDIFQDDIVKSYNRKNSNIF